MLSFSQSVVQALRLTIPLLFVSVLAQSAAVTVSPTVTSIGGGLYQYAYSISYTGTDDAFLVDLSVPSDPTAISNLTAPTGFKDQFDSVNGLVSFLEDTSLFTATPTSGFSFDSPDAPGSANFTASVLDSSFNIYTISGTTTAPISPAPEPAYAYFIAFLAPLLLMGNFRKVAGRAKPQSINPMETLHVSGN